MHTRDPWLSSLTFGSDGSRVSLHSFGSRSSRDARGSLESWEPRDTVQAWVSLVTFLSELPIGTRETFGSWQSRKTPDDLAALAVSSFAFPSLLPAGSWETGRSGVTHSPF